jgi:hypothetical protein
VSSGEACAPRHAGEELSAMANLTGVSITFHTNDEDKDGDTRVEVVVRLRNGGAIVAQIADELGHFDDNSDNGPFDLLVLDRASRDDLKAGGVAISIAPNGNDTWRFNFFLDLRFSDGGHLCARATGLELTQDVRSQAFGIE